MATPSEPIDSRGIHLAAQEEPDIDAFVARHTTHIETMTKPLNETLATELVSVLRYRHHYFLALAIHSPHAAERFMAHADAGLRHADLLADRIVQLGGAPNFSPEALTLRSHAGHFSGDSLPGAIREDLLAVGRMIDGYRDMLATLGENDPITRQILKGILTVKEAHADALSELLVARFRASASMLETYRQTRPALTLAL